MTKSRFFDRNKPYNQLPLLPPNNDVIDKEVLLQWGYSSRKLAELNKNILRLPSPEMLINTISLQEAKASTAIENIFTTNDELYKAVSESQKEEDANPATKEVLRYREALWIGNHDVADRGEVDIDTIIKVYQQIKDTSDSLRPPQSLTVIRRGDSEFRSGEVIYTPPRGKGIIEEKLQNLFSYLNDFKKYPIDPLLKMAIAHYQFEAIHPFSDGNGRTGRVLNLIYLTNQGLLSHPVLYLSKYIIENKDEYYHNLNAITQRGAWKDWILFIMKAVNSTSSHTNAMVEQIIDQMEATYTYGKENLKWYSKEINEVIFSQPYIKPAIINKILDKSSRTTLTKYMNELKELQILTPKQDGKEVYYINNDLINILEG